MDGILRVERVVVLLDVWLDADLFPFPKMKVKVLERSSNDYLAITNVYRLDTKSREPEYVSGLAETVENAIDDLLVRFVSDVRENSERPLTEQDFEWSASEDF